MLKEHDKSYLEGYIELELCHYNITFYYPITLSDLAFTKVGLVALHTNNAALAKIYREVFLDCSFIANRHVI